jgi:16S rRNA (guanine527-N7)-methyltransferase
MTVISSESAAREWLAALPDVSRETIDQLECFAALLSEENARQNLVAASTLGETFWSRHIVDSAQLLALAPAKGGTWIDLGSGPGLPGLVIAILAPQWLITLVESRRLRCDFLSSAIAALGLADRTKVVHDRVEALPPFPSDVISARAFAPLPRLITTARHLANKSTIWLLPKGKNAVNELSTLPAPWQTRFHVKPSLTDSEARILVGQGNFP